MILTETIEIKINRQNIEHYLEKGYTCNLTDIIKIKAEDVTQGSNKIIKTSCEVCGMNQNLKIQAYWKNYNKHGYNFYSCNRCCAEKREMTCLTQYGVSNIFQSEKIKEEIKQTCLKNNDVEHLFRPVWSGKSFAK